MKTSSCIRLALGLAAALAAGALRAQDCRVDVVVDLTDAGRQLARPTAENPVYYFPFASGYREIGNISKTSQQTPPPPEAVEQLFFRALAADNYRLITKQSPPTLLLVFEWGYIVPHFRTAIGTDGRTDSSGNSDETAAMLGIVGGNYLNSDLTSLDDTDPVKDALLDATKTPRYFVRITAFDFKSSLKKERVLLWTARVSTEAEGLSLADAIPTLIAAGAPRYGKATVKPVLFSAPIVRGN